MSKLYQETIQGLLEAVAIEKGEIPVIEKNNMPAKTLVAVDKVNGVIDKAILKQTENMIHNQLI